MTPGQLEQLYQEARTALKAKNYDRASDLFRQILLIDENFKDASRLLAQTVKLRRRRWYNQPFLWAGLGLAALVALGVWLLPIFSPLATRLVPAFAATLSATITPASTMIPAYTPSPTPTSIPLAWKRIYLGKEFTRDTVNVIIVDPRDPEVIYGGMQNAGIYKSIDAGLSWLPSHAGLEAASINSMVIDPQDPSTLYAGVFNNAVYKTEDGGQSWRISQRNEGNWPWCSDVIMDYNDPSHLFYSDGYNLWSTENGGGTWMARSRQVENTSFFKLAISSTDGNLLYGSLHQFGLYISRDGGGSWSSLGLGAGEGEHIGDLWIDPYEENTLYVKVYGPQGYFMKSTDAGVSWKEVTSFDCLGMAFDPADVNLEYCANGQGIYRTTDGELHWSEIAHFVDRSVSLIALSPLDLDSIFAGSQGMFHSTDAGLTWQPSENGLGAARTEFFQNYSDSDSLYLVEGTDIMGWGGRILRSLDGGISWDFINDRGGGSVSFDADGQTMYWSSYGELQGSKDGGRTWYPIYSSSAGEEFIAHPTRAGVIYGINGVGTSVLISWDGGRNWQSIDTHDDCDTFQRIYFAGGGSQVLYANGSCPSGTARSVDDGQSWQVCANLDTEKKISRSSLVMDPRDGGHIFLATNGGGIKSSTDGCQSWQDSNTGLGSLFINSIAMDPNHPDIIYTGTDNGAYVSFDSGGHWGQINDGLLGATVVYSIMVDSGSNVYAATPYGIFKLEGK